MGWSRSRSKSHSSSSSDGGHNNNDTTETGNKTISTTNFPVNQTELCECFNLELLADPFEMDDEICYYYRLEKIGNASYCNRVIDYIILLSGNSDDECDALSNNTNLLLSFSPRCYKVLTYLDGVIIDVDNKKSSLVYTYMYNMYNLCCWLINSYTHSVYYVTLCLRFCRICCTFLILFYWLCFCANRANRQNCLFLINNVYI